MLGKWHMHADKVYDQKWGKAVVEMETDTVSG